MYPPPHTPPAASTQPPAVQNGLQGATLTVLIGAIAMAVGSVLPWASVLSIFGTLEIKGVDGSDGKFVAAAGCVAALLVLTSMKGRSTGIFLWCAIAGLAGGGLAVRDYVDLRDKVGELSSEAGRASVGYGLYVCIGGAAAVLIGALIGRSQLRRTLS